MASVTQTNLDFPLHPSTSPAIRIESPHGFFELGLREVRAYRELLYFFVSLLDYAYLGD